MKPLATICVALACLLFAPPAPAGSRDGVTPFDSFDPSISDNGRFVAFDCYSDALGDGDANGQQDVLLRDLKTGTTTLVSLSSAGAQGNGFSGLTAISANGRFVAFESSATNLVDGDTNGTADIFVRDRKTGTTTRASVSSAGDQADGDSGGGLSLSSSGRFVAFQSDAGNLVPGDASGHIDIFVRDLKHGKTVRASVSSDGTEANNTCDSPVLSASGRFVAFETSADNLVAGDTNNKTDVFVHDLKTGKTTRASLGAAGAEGDQNSFDPAISANGRYVVFDSTSTTFVADDTNLLRDVFRRDLAKGLTARVSVGAGGTEADDVSYLGKPSANGRLVSFNSLATNLVEGDGNGVQDVFLADVKQGTTVRVSLGAGGEPEESVGSGGPSRNGRWVTLASYDDTLVPGDTNAASDVFLRDVKQQTTVRVSVGSQGQQAGP